MDGKGPIINIIAALFLSLSWITVLLRCFVRVFMQAHFGLDDAFAIASLASFTVLSGAIFYGTSYGIGKHIFTLTLKGIGEGLKAYFIFELFYVISTCLVKVSFCLSLLRIANVRFQKYAIYVVLTVTVIFSIFYFAWILTECHPVSFLWEQFLGNEKGQCRPINYMIGATYAHGVVMFLGDLSLAVLPVVLVLDLHLNLQTKASVAILLALGSVASVATIARIPYVHRLEDIDFLYANNELLIWSIVEVGISIVATGAATLRPLVAKGYLFPWKKTNNYSAGKRFAGASTRTDWSSLAEHMARANSMGGGQRNTRAASEWHSQHTRVASEYEEGRERNSALLEEQPVDWENDQSTVTITATTWQGELDEFDVPKGGIQKTVEISQSSLRK